MIQKRMCGETDIRCHLGEQSETGHGIPRVDFWLASLETVSLVPETNEGHSFEGKESPRRCPDCGKDLLHSQKWPWVAFLLEHCQHLQQPPHGDIRNKKIHRRLLCLHPKILIFRGHYSFKKDELTSVQNRGHRRIRDTSTLVWGHNSLCLRFLKCKEKPSSNLGGEGLWCFPTQYHETNV